MWQSLLLRVARPIPFFTHGGAVSKHPRHGVVGVLGQMHTDTQLMGRSHLPKQSTKRYSTLAVSSFQSSARWGYSGSGPKARDSSHYTDHDPGGRGRQKAGEPMATSNKGRAENGAFRVVIFAVAGSSTAPARTCCCVAHLRSDEDRRAASSPSAPRAYAGGDSDC